MSNPYDNSDSDFRNESGQETNLKGKYPPGMKIAIGAGILIIGGGILYYILRPTPTEETNDQSPITQDSSLFKDNGTAGGTGMEGGTGAAGGTGVAGGTGSGGRHRSRGRHRHGGRYRHGGRNRHG